MKIITWNVNGIRARGAQLVELIERERPDVLCLQELKAKREQVPEALCGLAGYWCYWHGASAYSGVGLHLKKDRFSEAPAFAHPSFDHETRIVEARIGNLSIASVYVNIGWRLDYVLATEDLARSALSCPVLREFGSSDHGPVVATFGD